MNEEMLSALNAENLKSEYDKLDHDISELGTGIELTDRLEKVNNKLKSLLGEYEKTLELIEAHESHKLRAEKLRDFIKEAIQRKAETLSQLNNSDVKLYYSSSVYD